jgi:hypothetical protein
MAAGDLSFLQSIQAGSGTHPTSYSLETRNPVHGDKVAHVPLVLSLLCLPSYLLGLPVVYVVS